MPESDLERFWGKVKKTATCWLWNGDPKSYGRFFFEGFILRAHRFSWEIVHGEIGDLHVLHKCDVPGCVRPSHLFLGTHSDNMRDRDSKGRQPVGIRNGRAKLSPRSVAAIRRARAQGTSLKTLSKKYGIHVSGISRLTRGAQWASC